MGEAIRYFRRAARQGTWPLFQRYLVAPRIFELPPVAVRSDGDFAVHTLLCEGDTLMYHWMLRSLLNVWPEPFHVTVHDDGSLTESSVDSLRRSFPGIEIIRNEKAESRVVQLLQSYPALKAWRSSTHWAIKAIDTYLLGRSRFVILVDSDVLFFARPTELFSRDGKSAWMRDSSYMLDIQPEMSVAQFGGYPLPQLNAGLGRIQRNRLNLEVGELLLRFLPRPSNDMIFHAIMTAQNPEFDLLPDSYDCPCPIPFRRNLTARHYTNPVRVWFYEEGVPQVAALLGMPLHRWLRDRP